MTASTRCPKCGSALEAPRVEDVSLSHGTELAFRGVRVSHGGQRCHTTFAQVIEPHPGWREITTRG